MSDKELIQFLLEKNIQDIDLIKRLANELINLQEGQCKH